MNKFIKYFTVATFLGVAVLFANEHHGHGNNINITYNSMGGMSGTTGSSSDMGSGDEMSHELANMMIGIIFEGVELTDVQKNSVDKAFKDIAILQEGMHIKGIKPYMSDGKFDKEEFIKNHQKALTKIADAIDDMLKILTKEQKQMVILNSTMF